MTTGTHLSFYFFVSNIFGVPLTIEYILAGIAGTLLPDIDNPKGGIGKIPNPLTNYIFRKYGHRTITHSWFMVALPTLTFPITYPLQIQGISWTLMFAILAHIFLDANNFKGIQLFYPNKLAAVLPMDTRFRTEIGSSREKHLIAVLTILAVITIPVGVMGYARIVNYITASQKAAIKDYKDAVNKHLITIKITDSINRITQEAVKDEFTAIAVMENNDILVEDKHQNRLTVGRTNDAIIYIEQINVSQKKPVKIFTHTYNLEKTGWEPVLKALSYKNSYAYGDVLIDSIPEEEYVKKTAQFYHGVQYTYLLDQNKAMLKYASLRDIILSGLASTHPIKGEIIIRGIENTPNYYAAPENEIARGHPASIIVPMSVSDIKASIGQLIKRGDILAEDRAEIYVLDKKISELRSKIKTVKISIDDKPDTLIDRSISLEKDMLMLDTKIKAQKKLIEQVQLRELPNTEIVIQGEEARLEGLEEQRAIKQKEYDELKRALEEKSKFVKDTAISQSQEITEKINVTEAEKERFRWRSPYNGKVKNIRPLKNWPDRTAIIIETYESPPRQGGLRARGG